VTPARLATKLGWWHKSSFDALMKEMVEANMMRFGTSTPAATARAIPGKGR
jgi:hypothetical protein